MLRRDTDEGEGSQHQTRPDADHERAPAMASSRQSETSEHGRLEIHALVRLFVELPLAVRTLTRDTT